MKKNGNSLRTRFGALTLAMVMALGTLAGCAASDPVETAPEVTEPAVTTPAETTTPEVETTETTEPVALTMEGDTFGNGAIGENGGVSSGSLYSSQAGLEILMAGGNAIDAAVATAFAVGVCEPYLSGIGGCGMMTIYLSDTHEYEVLEYMETVPLALEPGWFDPDTDWNTAKNAAVPGQVHGLLTALELYGTMTREEVMAPAIALARDGFAMEARLAEAIVGSYDLLSEEALEVYTNDGIPYNEGDWFTNEPLANTLQAISDGGIEAFYEGEIAEQIVAGLQAGGSLMEMEDLAIYETMEREPISTTYYGYEVVTVPPPSNGGDWLLQSLNMMEEMDIASMEFNSFEYITTFGEITRIAMADSYTYIGDPAFYDLPVDELISKEYAAERVTAISSEQAMTEIPDGPELTVEKLEATAPDSLHTTHIAVIDQYGNIVSTTNTLGYSWGCKYYAPGLGFFYNSHVGNLDHENPDSPDYVMPGKRVRSTISPSLVLNSDGEPIMAVGSPGSYAIPPAIAMIINNVLLYGMNIQEAINEPRAMAIGGGDSNVLTIEQPRFDTELVEQLVEYGYEMNDVGEYNMSVGGIAAIYLDRDEGIFYAGADPRRGYKALAY